MKNRKQILILFGGIIVAVLLIISNLRSKEVNGKDIAPTSQKKPHPPSGEQGFFDSFLLELVS
ncbi:hypothetical protein [Ekhidna sp.]|uniref:hypothetical protein n=1 Tax=Ekhidna sp. TaxID=2608089 RepID=UPI0032EEEDB5